MHIFNFIEMFLDKYENCYRSRKFTLHFQTPFLHAGYCTLLNPCSANTGPGRHSFTFQQDSLSDQTVLSAIRVLVSMAGNFPFCVLLTVEILGFFYMYLVFSLVFLVFYTTAYLLHVPIIQKVLLIMPRCPCFASCIVLYTNSSFTYNEAALSKQVA